VPISPKPGKYQLTAVADYRQGGEREQTTADTADLEVVINPSERNGLAAAILIFRMDHLRSRGALVTAVTST